MISFFFFRKLKIQIVNDPPLILTVDNIQTTQIPQTQNVNYREYRCYCNPKTRVNR